MTVWSRYLVSLRRDTRPKGSCAEETCPFDRGVISVGILFQSVPPLSALSNCSWFHKSRAAIVMEMYIHCVNAELVCCLKEAAGNWLDQVCPGPSSRRPIQRLVLKRIPPPSSLFRLQRPPRRKPEPRTSWAQRESSPHPLRVLSGWCLVVRAWVWGQ